MPNPLYGESYEQDLVSRAIMSTLGITGRDVKTPGDYLREAGLMGLGQGYPYYGSPYPGAEPVEKDNWDKFMEFNNSVMPMLSNVLGSWIQGRYQALSAQSMAEAFKGMSTQQQSQVMQAYMVNQMMAQQGLTPSMNPQMMNNMGQAFQMLPPNQFNSAYGLAVNNLNQSASGSAGMQALINRAGAQLQGGGGFSIPGWAIVGGLAAVAVVGYLAWAPKKGGMSSPMRRFSGRHYR